jgi:hypothetical protein
MKAVKMAVKTASDPLLRGRNPGLLEKAYPQRT